MVPVVSILEIIYHIVTFKMAKMLFLFLFFVVTNLVERSNICGLALCQKKNLRCNLFSSLSEWMNESEWNIVDEKTTDGLFTLCVPCIIYVKRFSCYCRNFRRLMKNILK